MQAAELVYEYKKEYGLPILDQKREEQVIAANSARIEDPVIRGYYIDYLKNVMAVSRAYQYRMQSGLKVAYSGVEGAFAHIAAGRIFWVFMQRGTIPVRLCHSIKQSLSG